MRTLVALLGLAAIMAVFAGIHYSTDPVRFQEEHPPAFVIGEGEVRSAAFQPTLAETPIHITLAVGGGPVDVYVIPSTQASSLAREGRIALDAPFTYDARWSLHNVSGLVDLTIVSDGRTWYDLVLDNSDNYYDGDAAPAGTVTVELTARYVAIEERSLMFAYLAVVPSILLVAVTAGNKLRRLIRGARRNGTPPSP